MATISDSSIPKVQTTPNTVSERDLDKNKKRSKVKNGDPKEKLVTKNATKLNVILTFVLLIIAILLYDNFLNSPPDPVDINSLETDLKLNVFGQTDTILEILTNLRNFNEKSAKDHIQVLTFIGASGVGKTLMSDLIKKNFLANIYQITGPFTNPDEYFLTSIKHNLRKTNLVIIDDLTKDEVHLVNKIIKSIPRDTSLLLICIFNILETDSNLNYSINYKNIELISESLKKSDIYSSHILFNAFSENEAKAWLSKELKARNYEIKNDDLIMDVVVAHKVNFLGLKGLVNKVIKSV